MFGMNGTTQDETRKVVKAAADAAFRNIGHAAASIRRTAFTSIVRSAKPSAPGTPPHTRGKKRGFKRGMFYAMEGKEAAVIGTAYSIVGTSGEPHEHGGIYKGDDYEARPFMGPALEANLDRFARNWGGSIGE